MLSATAAAITLVFGYLAIREAKRSQELTIIDRVYDAITQLEEQFYDAVLSGNGETVLPTWRGRFLNRLEYFSFLVNHNYLGDAKLVNFFSVAVVRWYEDIFDKLADQNEKADPQTYPELKALYAKLKSQS